MLQRAFFSFWYNELYWHFGVYFDISLKFLSGKNTQIVKQTKYSGVVKLVVQWTERDTLGL